MSSCVSKLNELVGALAIALTDDDKLPTLFETATAVEVAMDEEELCDCSSEWVV
jgi:hypothetical protein